MAEIWMVTSLKDFFAFGPLCEVDTKGSEGETPLAQAGANGKYHLWLKAELDVEKL